MVYVEFVLLTGSLRWFLPNPFIKYSTVTHTLYPQSTRGEGLESPLSLPLMASAAHLLSSAVLAARCSVVSHAGLCCMAGGLSYLPVTYIFPFSHHLLTFPGKLKNVVSSCQSSPAVAATPC